MIQAKTDDNFQVKVVLHQINNQVNDEPFVLHATFIQTLPSV